MNQYSSVTCNCLPCWDQVVERPRWLREAAERICHGASAEVELAYRRRASTLDCSLQLDSAVLVYLIDIADATELTDLCRHILFLTVSLTGDLSCAEESVKDVRLRFRNSLEAYMTASKDDRPRLLQLNALMKEFLESAMSRSVPLIVEACDKFSIGDNRALLRPLVKGRGGRADKDGTFVQLETLVAKSPAFEECGWEASDIRSKARRMCESTRIGLEQPVTDIPKPLGEALSVGSWHIFRAYRAHAMYQAPMLEPEWTNMLLLLTFSHSLPWSQREAVKDWFQTQAGESAVNSWKSKQQAGDESDITQRHLVRAGLWIAQYWREGLSSDAVKLAARGQILEGDDMEQSAEDDTGVAFKNMLRSDLASEAEVLLNELVSAAISTE